ncbi:hypothetical protein CRG98_037339 [Punica granatum]|uniref:Uncharacterized protein n=1 Tax=Punica granatum TaxID=22663 RepID=A0A2I0IE38_PUNGR|nr:hypothetical protein CRG98_037339 [Punica granatum]
MLWMSLRSHGSRFRVASASTCGTHGKRETSKLPSSGRAWTRLTRSSTIGKSATAERAIIDPGELEDWGVEVTLRPCRYELGGGSGEPTTSRAKDKIKLLKNSIYFLADLGIAEPWAKCCGMAKVDLESGKVTKVLYGDRKYGGEPCRVSTKNKSGTRGK